jgi:hypothetical protein
MGGRTERPVLGRRRLRMRRDRIAPTTDAAVPTVRRLMGRLPAHPPPIPGCPCSPRRRGVIVQAHRPRGEPK